MRSSRHRDIHPCDHPGCPNIVDTFLPYVVMIYADSGTVNRYCSKLCRDDHNPVPDDALILSADSLGLWGHLYDRDDRSQA